MFLVSRPAHGSRAPAWGAGTWRVFSESSGADEDLGRRWEDRPLFVEDVIYYTLSRARPRQPLTNGLTRKPCVVGTTLTGRLTR